MDEEKWLEELFMGIWPEADEQQESPADLGTASRQHAGQKRSAQTGRSDDLINEFNNLVQVMVSSTELALAELSRQSAPGYEVQHTAEARAEVQALLQQLFLFNSQIAETIVQVLAAAAEQGQSGVTRGSDAWMYLRQAVEIAGRARALIQQMHHVGQQITHAM